MEYFKDTFDPKLCVYRKKYGIELVLIKLISSQTYTIDNNNFVCTVLRDLSKPFDCIPCGLLITKISAYSL